MNVAKSTSKPQSFLVKKGTEWVTDIVATAITDIPAAAGILVGGAYILDGIANSASGDIAVGSAALIAGMTLASSTHSDISTETKANEVAKQTKNLSAKDAEFVRLREYAEKKLDKVISGKEFIDSSASENGKTRIMELAKGSVNITDIDIATKGYKVQIMSGEAESFPAIATITKISKKNGRNFFEQERFGLDNKSIEQFNETGKLPINTQNIFDSIDSNSLANQKLIKSHTLNSLKGAANFRGGISKAFAVAINKPLYVTGRMVNNIADAGIKLTALAAGGYATVKAALLTGSILTGGGTKEALDLAKNTKQATESGNWDIAISNSDALQKTLTESSNNVNDLLQSTIGISPDLDTAILLTAATFIAKIIIEKVVTEVTDDKFKLERRSKFKIPFADRITKERAEKTIERTI